MSGNTLWIPDMADHYLTINQPEDQGCEADHLHLTELRYRPRATRPRPWTRTKKIGRIMDRRRFRFHTAHVRSVRITVSRWSIQLGKRGRKLITLRCNNSKTRHYWPKNKFPSASCQWMRDTNLHGWSINSNTRSSSNSPPFGLGQKWFRVRT